MLTDASQREPAVRPLQWSIIVRIFALMQPFRVKRNWLLFCVVIRAIQQPAFAWAIGAIIDGPIARSQNMRLIFISVALFSLLCIVMQLTLHFRQRLTLELGEAVVNNLRRDVFNHLQRMPMAYFHRTKVGRILSRVSGDCNAVRTGVQDVMFVSLIGLGQMFFAGLLMAWYSVTLFLIVIAMSPLFWLANRLFQSRLSQAYRDIQENFSKVTSWIAENIAGMKVTQAFVRGPQNAEQFATMVDRHASHNMRATRISGLFLPLIELNSQLFLAALIAVGGTLALQGNQATPLRDLIQFFFLANIFFNPIQVLASQYNQALTAMAGAERVFDLLAMPVDTIDEQASLEVDRLQGEIEFRNVSFGYQAQTITREDTEKAAFEQSATTLVLRDVSLRIAAGQTVALVGASGGGKSTLSNLIPRFYSPTSGSIIIDGYDLASLSRATLTRNIAIVPQQNYLFSGTIADNLRLPVPNAKDDELWYALCELGCADIVESLPDGLSTEVGSRGATLSAGQRQVICLARAMLARPSILILDEATSSIDTMTELRIQAAITRLQENRTTIIIAHRLSTIRTADQIFVLDTGQIVQRGTHESLREVPGVYANMLHRYAGSL